MADHDVGHLDEAAWDRLAANALGPEERDRYFDHVTACPDCSRVWRGILTLKSEAETRGLIATQAAARPWWRTPMVPLAIAASVILAVAGFFVTLRTDVDPAAVRGASSMPSIEGLVVAYSSDNLPQFTWAAVSGATKYRLEIFTEDGTSLWTGDVTGPPASWPAALPHPNGRYRWRIEAEGADGPIARSRLTALEIDR